MRVLPLLLALSSATEAVSVGQRRKVVRSFNVRRTKNSDSTPLQVGNGNFAFGADITGLQTFKPYAIMSHMGLAEFQPANGPWTDFHYTGLQMWTHGRLVTYEVPNSAQNDISNWLRENPHRLNLANVGFDFGRQGVTEDDLQHKSQTLDLWTGRLSSSFVYDGSPVKVETWADPDSDTIAVSINSKLLKRGLGLFFDFPYPDKEKFNAPFVGHFNLTSKHSTLLDNLSSNSARIKHALDATTYYTHVSWRGQGKMSGPTNGTHRYTFTTSQTSTQLIVTLSPSPNAQERTITYSGVTTASRTWWQTFWTTGAFIDLTSVTDPRAHLLQLRIILSQYLTAINSASNGWHGKFHLEMTLWHTLPFARWNRFPLLWRSQPATYEQFLPSAVARARMQGYGGARWGKMSDPSGRSAPGEINALLIWQQPHPMYFAEVEYRAHPNVSTLRRWDGVVSAAAEFMASYAWWNQSSGVYDLGPPMYPVSENTNPNCTRNPTFELAYWRFGLEVAVRWKERLGEAVPAEWVAVRDRLAPLPMVDGTYVVYEGIEGMWTSNATTNGHPAMAGLYGLLPPPASGKPLDTEALKKTAAKIRELWALKYSYGWDFAMLAMNSLRLGDPEQAVEYLLHPIFQFDDAGYPVGGSRGKTGHWPTSWEKDVQVGGFLPAL
ncbi:hypothetical protein N657DRAFT_658192 [Parathielavia appendiculata]|uniref:Six-hairpin glycosidase-like protein n=1 Tax=Parathielavia appendiculata TaxID=2587402 RepID=A0AAN6Z0E9_9PEZI|nr:hypothetical protein N657DRAFT_658192 [Parathielavia appendiculata]